MTRKPARLKTFMPNRMSLVSTAPLPLAGINSGMRRSRILPEPRQPGLRAGHSTHVALKGEFQATVRSATSTLPFVSGLNSTATRKMAKPTTVVTRIGPDKPIW